MAFEWFQKRWFEFRLGHGTYLGFFLSFVNFMLITYNLFLEKFLDVNIFGGLLGFGLILTIIYIPVCIIFGYFHVVKQMKYDSGMQFGVTPQVSEIIERLKRIEEKISSGDST